MKKLKIIIPAILLIIVVGLLSAYFIYGSTLIDITNEKSIINALSSDSDQPIIILKTAQNGDYFGVLYSDPADGDDECFHFRYITRAKLYKNKYHNLGSASTSYVIPNNDDPEMDWDVLDTDIFYYLKHSDDKKSKTVRVFLSTFEGNSFKSNKCSVFECNSSGVIIEEGTNEKQVVEMMQKLADSYKKIDEFDLPNEQIYIIPKTYELSKADNQISFEIGSVSEDEMRNRTMKEAEAIIKELKESKQ